ncbi:MAG: EAL domain-containing response regulator [Burkholderiales bacterium]
MPDAAPFVVLVVDDQDTVRAQLRLALRSLGVSEVLEAADGQSALAVLADAQHGGVRPQLVLLDLRMPGMDGIELMRRIAETDLSLTVALVSAVDARVMRAAAQLSREHGLSLGGFYAKPLHASQLRPLIERLRGDVRTEVRRSASDVEELAQALRQGEIVPHYQPVVDLKSGRVTGLEALARWRHPTRGLVLPKDFIPLAEHMGLIARLTDVVVTRALEDLATLDGLGYGLHLAVNLSARGVDRADLPDVVEARTTHAGLSPDRVTFEITETQLSSNPIAFLELVSRLRLKGFELSIDDFGTGQSTLEQLRRLPFTELKVDATFMQGALHDPLSKAILESCVDVARRLELHVVAEGIETQECMSLARDLGCDHGQGYFISRPLSFADLPAWLQDWDARLSKHEATG